MNPQTTYVENVHTPLRFNNNSVSRTFSHKYFSFIFDKQMTFEQNIQMVLSDQKQYIY